MDASYNGTCYQPPNTTRQAREKTEDEIEEDGYGPTPTNPDATQPAGLARVATQMLLDGSVDANAANLTEMNLVNDATGVSQSQINNDRSMATLTVVTQDQTASQVLLDAAESAAAAPRLGANRNHQNHSLPIQKATSILGGGTGGPPEKDASMCSQSELDKMKLNPSNLRLNENSDSSGSARNVVCRICLSEEEHENPLICPCKCSGSMG